MHTCTQDATETRDDNEQVSYLFDAAALLFVTGIAGQLEVFGHILVAGRLLDAQLLSEFQDLLLQLCDGLPRALGVETGVLRAQQRTVRPV